MKGYGIFWNLVILITFSLINIICYTSLMKCLKFGLDIGLYIDLFASNNVIMLISVFTYKIFYLLWLAPLYLAYLGLKKVWTFMGKDYKDD
jgi:hypothetical protein